MSAIDEVIATGERSISALLDNANVLSGLIQASFPESDLDKMSAKFSLALQKCSKGDIAINADVAKLCGLVRQHAAQAVEEIRNCEMWLAMKAPSVSDGNNFGVDVQNFVLTELAAMRAKLQGMLDAFSTYHWQRGLAVEKLPKGKSSESTTSESTETEEKDGKTTATSKTSKGTSTKATEELAIADFVSYTVELDVKAYHNAYLQLSDIRNCYIKASSLFSKNMKRLADPRGEGEDGGNRNVMSMF